ncbi:YciI family protein [Fulvivirga ligni]|uniref:YciI family protein n=1 Tax=Fulvivirga ligni TaxID=2904246 RepID=UPI001F45A552|nr:YciI family protein [Fulvivirga ligni]UII23984.1 YciI family protein [Fulvivirga ligni]
MDNFLLLIRENIAEANQLTEEQMQQEIEAYTQWVESLGSQCLGGDPLDNYGKYMTKDSIESDGPFIESKEVITGYILVQAESLEAAVELSKTCPVFQSNGALEVRPIMKY